MKLDTFGAYVHRRLDSWGREFALGRDCEYLGYHSKNMLQVLIEHKGEIPQRGGGHKPQECDVLALEVERIVAEIARDQMPVACCLRAYYCGDGRKRYERHETANALLVMLHCRTVSVRQYLGLVEQGELMVRGWLLSDARQSA